MPTAPPSSCRGRAACGGAAKTLPPFVLAERHETHDVLTLDERHLRALRVPGGRPFRLLPSDA